MKSQEELKAIWDSQRANSQYAPNDNHSLQQIYDPSQAQASALPHTQSRDPGFSLSRFAGDVVNTTSTLSKGALVGGLKFIGHSATTVAREAAITAKSFTTDKMNLQRRQSDLNKQYDILSAKQDALIKEYKAGNVSKQDYINSLKDLADSMQGLSDGAQDIAIKADPMGRAIAVADTAATLLSLGEFGLVGAERAAAVGVAADVTGARTLFEKGAIKLEEILTTGKLGEHLAVNSVLERNLGRQATREAQKLAGESAAAWGVRESKHIAAQLLIKRPLVYEWNIHNASDIYTDIIKGDYPDALKSAAWAGVQALEGGPIGAFFKLGKWGKTKVVRTFLDQGSFIDELSSRIGDKNPRQIAEFIQSAEKGLSKEKFSKLNEYWRIIAATNMKIAGGKVSLAVDNFMSSYLGREASKLSPSELYRDAKNWVESHQFLAENLGSIEEKLRRAGAKAQDIKDVRKYVVVRWNTATKTALADALERAGTKALKRGEGVFVAIGDTYKELAASPRATWSNNRVLGKNIEQILNDAAKKTSTDEEMIKYIAKEIKRIGTADILAEGIPRKVGKYLGERGFTVAVPAGNKITPTIAAKDAPKLLTHAVGASNDVFDKATNARAGTKWLVTLINKAGLSPESSNKIAYLKLSEQVSLQLGNTPLAKELTSGIRGTDSFIDGGTKIINKLRQFIDEKAPSRIGKKISFGRARASAVQDIRQLSISEYAKALNVTEKEAKLIKREVIEGYLKVPIEVRGLGDSVVDILYKVNPLYGPYSRAQSALRYTYNPFFTVLERFETSSLSRMEAGRLAWGKSRAELDAAVVRLKIGEQLSGSLPGQGQVDNVLGSITAQIDHAQERNLAGLALTIAKKKGITLDEMITKHPDELTDALRVVVQYPREGILSSSLARTLNLAFFPVRYNTKVTLMAAKALMKQPPTVQFATISSLFRLGDWLQSPEGVKWRSDNSEVIQILGWLTPVGSVTSTLKLLSGGIETPSDLGLLGGLPLGIITQTLDSLGYIHINAPYVNPKTGNMIPDYIPITNKAKAATAFQDLLGSVFTYPGRTIGLPGKSAAIRNVVNDFISTNGKDFEKRLDKSKLTSTQRNFIKVLKGDISEETFSRMYEEADANGNVWASIPSIDLPFKKLPSKLPKVPKKVKPVKGRRPKARPIPIPARGTKI